jgi:hypothetical protein
LAAATPLISAVEPGPSVDRHAPTPPVTIACASAMNAAVPSLRARTTSIPRCRDRSMNSMIGSPG